MDDWKQDRIGSCERGENPTLIAKMKSGFAVIADNQFLPGYCILLSYPNSASINDLPMEDRKQYLLDMTLIGDAIIEVCNPLRLNYSTLMNLDHFLHTHIEARYEWEPDEYRCRPSWFYPRELRYGDQYEYSDEKFGELKNKIREALLRLMDKAGYIPVNKN